MTPVLPIIVIVIFLDSKCGQHSVEHVTHYVPSSLKIGARIIQQVDLMAWKVALHVFNR